MFSFFGIMNLISFRVSTSCALFWGPNPSKVLGFLKWLLPSICDYMGTSPLLFCLSILLFPIITKSCPSVDFWLFKKKNPTKKPHPTPKPHPNKKTKKTLVFHTQVFWSVENTLYSFYLFPNTLDQSASVVCFAVFTIHSLILFSYTIHCSAMHIFKGQTLT